MENIESKYKQLDEVDNLLNEKEQSLKKKIFNLAKMETLVFADPKLSAKYDEMAENGAEKFGYHFNETIQNILFNDYVLNSSKYLQKYKMAIPKVKKRRDKSGINKIRHDSEKIAIPTPQAVEETTSAGSAGGAAGYVGYAGPAAWAKGGEPMRKPMYVGGVVVGEGVEAKNYLTDPDIFKLMVENFDREGVINKIGKDSDEFGTETNKMSNADLNIIDNDIKNKTIGVSQVGSVDEMAVGGRKISTIDELKAYRLELKQQGINGLRKEDIPLLADEALYSIAIKMADNLINLRWDDLPDVNSMWDYIKRNGGMTFESLSKAVKRGLNVRLKEDGYSLKDFGIKEEIEIEEKAVSKSQQRFMGMVHGVQTGQIPKNKVSGEVVKTAKSMKAGDVEDFASTKHKNLPDSIDEYDYNNTNAKQDDLTPDEVVNANLDGIKQLVNDCQSIIQLGGMLHKFLNSNHIMDRDDAVAVIKATNKMFKNKDITESSMLDPNDTSMVTKPPIDAQGGGIDRGMMSAGGGGGMNENNKKVNIIDMKDNEIDEMLSELDNLSEQHNKLVKMTEDRKPSSLVLKDRLGLDNQKNFKKDLQHSGTKEIIDIEKQLEYADQQTPVGDNPYKNGEDIERKISEKALENVGDSTSDGKHIPKRNMTDEEAAELDDYRLGLGDFKFDNEVGEKFENRMKTDMGDDFYAKRQRRLKVQANQPMYNKDNQPTSKGDGKPEDITNKFTQNLGESTMVTGRYVDSLNKSHMVDFVISESVIVETVNEDYFKVNLSGLGNTYANKLNTDTSKLEINENVSKVIDRYSFYLNEGKIYAVKNSGLLNENHERTNVISEGEVNKMKHLLGYQPNNFVNNKGNKRF